MSLLEPTESDIARNAERKARLARLTGVPKPSSPAPLPPSFLAEPIINIVEPEEPPEHDRDWLIISTPQRDFAEFPLLVTEIQRLVAKRYKLRRADILSHRRTANIVLPRQIAMYLAKTMTLRTLPDIGRRFGGRDHTTVLHAVHKIERMRATDPEFDAQIRALETAKEASTCSPKTL
jgi:hypothetical protein